MYYTSLYDDKNKRQPIEPDKLLQNLKTPTSLFESLSSVDHKKLYLDIDCKRTYHDDEEVVQFIDLVFKQLKETNEYYIYGGYCANQLWAYKYQLTFIPEADKPFSLHVVFPMIIIDSQQMYNCMYKVSHQCEFKLNFMFDQVVYGYHEKMRHPMFNKVHKQIACNRLIDNEGRVFDRSNPYVNTDIFYDSFITLTVQPTQTIDNKKLRDLLRLFYISELQDEQQDTCLHVIDNPSGFNLNELDSCLSSIQSLSSYLWRLDYELIDDQSKIPIIQDLRAVLQQYYQKLKE